MPRRRPVEPSPGAPAYAGSAGWPPRWQYSTRDPGGISPERIMPISPAIDLPSYTGSVSIPSVRAARWIASTVC